MAEKKSFNVKRTLGIGLNVLFYLIVVLLLIFSVANIRVKREDQIPNIFGIGFLAVQSDSMEGDNKDSFSEGDLVVATIADQDMIDNLKIGDVVTFFDRSINGFNTHRIIDFTTINDEKFIITQGDNTPAADQPIRADQVVAMYRSSIGGLGTALDFVQTPTGFAVAVVLPVALIMIYEAVLLVRNVIVMNRKKLEDEMSAKSQDNLKLLEEEKARLRAELLEELKKEQNKEN